MIMIYYNHDYSAFRISITIMITITGHIFFSITLIIMITRFKKIWLQLWLWLQRNRLKIVIDDYDYDRPQPWWQLWFILAILFFFAAAEYGALHQNGTNPDQLGANQGGSILKQSKKKI